MVGGIDVSSEEVASLNALGEGQVDGRLIEGDFVIHAVSGWTLSILAVGDSSKPTADRLPHNPLKRS